MSSVIDSRTPDEVNQDATELRRLFGLIGPPVPPQRIGRYEICGEIGSGGYGVVYRARDPILNRDVAIKVGLLPDIEADQKVLLKGAVVLARLRHPGIVPVFEVLTCNGQYAIVMEFAGRSLCEVLAWPTLPPLEELVRYCSQIAEALHYAHRRGVVHSDVKPGNILIDIDSDESTATIADFGLPTSSAGRSGLGSAHERR